MPVAPDWLTTSVNVAFTSATPTLSDASTVTTATSIPPHFCSYTGVLFPVGVAAIELIVGASVSIGTVVVVVVVVVVVGAAVVVGGVVVVVVVGAAVVVGGVVVVVVVGAAVVVVAGAVDWVVVVVDEGRVVVAGVDVVEVVVPTGATVSSWGSVRSISSVTANPPTSPPTTSVPPATAVKSSFGIRRGAAGKPSRRHRRISWAGRVASSSAACNAVFAASGAGCSGKAPASPPGSMSPARRRVHVEQSSMWRLMRLRQSGLKTPSHEPRRVELGALAPTVPSDQERTERTFHPVPHPLDEFVRILNRNAERVGELLALEFVTHVKVENFALAFVETSARLRQQGAEFVAAEVGGHVDLRPDVDARIIDGSRAFPCAQSSTALIASHGVQPGSEPFGVAELIELVGGGEEGVLVGVGGVVATSQHRKAQVVDAVAVTFVDVAQGALITGQVLADEFGVGGRGRHRQGW